MSWISTKPTRGRLRIEAIAALASGGAYLAAAAAAAQPVTYDYGVAIQPLQVDTCDSTGAGQATTFQGVIDPAHGWSVRFSAEWVDPEYGLRLTLVADVLPDGTAVNYDADAIRILANGAWVPEPSPCPAIAGMVADAYAIELELSAEIVRTVEVSAGVWQTLVLRVEGEPDPPLSFYLFMDDMAAAPNASDPVSGSQVRVADATGLVAGCTLSDCSPAESPYYASTLSPSQPAWIGPRFMDPDRCCPTQTCCKASRR